MQMVYSDSQLPFYLVKSTLVKPHFLNKPPLPPHFWPYVPP